MARANGSTRIPRLATRQAALLLYSVLVVLPAVVFGGLHWYQLVSDHDTQLERVPSNARGAATRMLEGMTDRVAALIESEYSRPFYHYQERFFEEEGTTEELPFLTSPLIKEEPPEGILAWFAYDYLDGRDVQVDVFRRTPESGEDWSDREPLRDFIRSLVKLEFRERVEVTLARPGNAQLKKVSFREAAVNRAPHLDSDCLKVDLSVIANMKSDQVDVRYRRFGLRFLRDDEGRVRILATRQVDIETQFEAAELPECFSSLGFKTVLMQGFLIDESWLLERMPFAVAHRVLDGSQRFIMSGEAPPSLRPTDALVELDLFEDLDVEVEFVEDKELGRMGVAIHTGDLEDRFSRQAWRFLGVAAMMIISLAIGMGLLVRSVRSSLEEARRTENFVASVTHELRTPIAAVKLYGEMLRDGWIADPDKQQDYLQRIVRETNRLDTLVDRVLQKRRLGGESVEPVPGDLALVIDEQIPDLKLTAGTYGEDLAFEVEPDMPPVLLIEEAVHAILANLVENARKYAPVNERDADSEPILIRSRLYKGSVVLEVLDRGPGIAEAERSRIFEAFYRVGDEKVRTTRGTGLGLHLVALQARAMKARVVALPRRGGGSLFRVTFKTLNKRPGLFKAPV
jgi:two-component system sensor histidine kinase CiaH